MPSNDAEIGNSSSLPEARSRSESRDSREDITNTLTSSLKYLDSDLSNLATQEDLANPSEEYNRLSWIKKSVTDAQQKILESKGDDTFTNTSQEFQQNAEGQKMPTGRMISLQEGIPVDDLINYLNKKAEKLDIKDPKQAAEKQKLINQAHLLYRNSRQFYKVPGRFHQPPTEDELAAIYSRKQFEANLISKDYRATGSLDEDWWKGEQALERRQELFLPKSARKTHAPKEKQIDTATGGIPSENDLYNVLEGGEDENSDSSSEPNPPVELDVNGIPGNRDLYNVLEPEESEEKSTNSPYTQTAQPIQRERTSLNVIRTDDPLDKNAALLARKDLHERMGKHAIWKFWRWPEKIALRLSQGGIENIQQERLRRACITNNVSFASLEMMKNAAAAANHEQSEQHRISILERFKKGRIVERENATQPIIEARRIIEGELKTAVMQDIIKPIIDGQITGTPEQQANEIRIRLTAFVKGHLNDPQVQELFGAGASDWGYVAEYFAIDLLEKAQAVKEQMDIHNENLDQVSAYVDLHFGIARDQSNTDTRSFVDRCVANARRRQNERLAQGAQEAGRITGWVLNPLTVGIAASLAADGVLRSVGWTSRAAGIAAPIAGAISGGVVAGARRCIELGGDLKMQNAELAMGESLPQRTESRNRLRKLFNRVAGLERRTDLLEYRYDSLNVDQLLNGTGNEQVNIPGDLNKPQNKRTLESIDSLLTKDLSQEANRQALAERMEEIRIRINRSKRNRVDLITYSDKTKVNQDLNKLYDGTERLENALREAGLDDAAIQNLKTAADNTWQDAFDRDQRQKDNDFNGYRRKQALGAGLFGAAVGATGAVAVQQGFAEIARHAPSAAELPIIGGIFKPGQTFAEKGLHEVGKNLGHTEWGTGPANIDSFAEIYSTDGRVDINDAITVQANADHTITLIDRATGQPVPNQPEIWTEANGHLVTTGNPDNLPDNMRSWVRTEIPSHSLHDQITEARGSGVEEKITAGKARITIEGEKAGVTLTNDQGRITSAGGSIHDDGVLHLESNNPDSLNQINQELKNQGFKGEVVDESTIQFIDHPSNLDKVREIVKDSKEISITFNGFSIHVVGHGATGDIDIIPNNPDFPKINGSVDQNGNLHFETSAESPVKFKDYQNVLEQARFTGVKVEEIPGKSTTETVTKDILEHFRESKMVEKARRLFWHDNSTPMHLNERGVLVGADGKELQFYHHLLNGDVVDLDMSKIVSQMTQGGGINWDFTVDREYNHVMNDIITNPDGTRTYKNFFFFITPNDTADSAREIIKIPVGPDGHAQLPPGSDLHKFFDTTSGKSTQLARFIEVAHQEPDGQRTILATSVGKGIDKITTTTTTTAPGIQTLEATAPNIPSQEKIETSLFTLDSTPPTAPPKIDLTPPSLETPPAMPTPFAPRYPLESTRKQDSQQPQSAPQSPPASQKPEETPAPAKSTMPAVSSTPEATLPQNLIEQANNQLGSTTQSTASLETTPQAVTDYLKTISLPYGSTIKEINSQINGNQLNITGNISTLLGTVKFEATLEADTSGTLRVARHKIDLPFLARSQKENIENQILSLNQTIINQINKNINSSWEVAGFKIAGDKLICDFRKKSTNVNSQLNLTPEQEENVARIETAVRQYAEENNLSEEEAYQRFLRGNS